jgi:hypothetical protein
MELLESDAMIYLDHDAAIPIILDVLEPMMPCLTT